MRVGDLVKNLPRNDHRHDNGLSRTRRHFGTQPPEPSAIGWNFDSHLTRRGRLREPDQGFGGFQLAEEKPTVLELFLVMPVFQQSLGYTCNTLIPRFTPCSHARANLVHQRNFDKMTWIIERTRTFRCDDIPSRATSHLPERTCAAHGYSSSVSLVLHRAS